MDRGQCDDSQVAKDVLIPGRRLVLGPDNGKALEHLIVLDGDHSGFQCAAGSAETGKEFDHDQLVGISFDQVAV